MSTPIVCRSRSVVTPLAPSSTAARAFTALLVFPLLTGLAAALRIPIPGLEVPLTFQTFVVVLSGACLGAGWGAISMGAYLVWGIVGLPVFALGTGTGSLAYLQGLTGGYLLAFPVAAALTGFILERIGQCPSAVSRFGTFLIGGLLILFSGTLFAVLHPEGPSVGVAAVRYFALFVPFAVGKSILATAATTPLSRRDS